MWWEEDFAFSLYPNDLIQVTHKSVLKLTNANKDSTLPQSIEDKTFMLYYTKANIAGGNIACQTHDSTYCVESLGIKTLEDLAKYTVDVLGKYHRIEREPRMPFHQKRS